MASGSSTANTPLTLLQWDNEPFSHRFIDLEGQLAFNVEVVGRDPNPIVRLSRDQAWYQNRPHLMGPSNAYFYLGPENALALGTVAYGGSGERVPMAKFLVPGKKEGSTSKYWPCQKGNGHVQYKWKVGSHRRECFNNRRTSLAIWQITQPGESEHFATLTVSPTGQPLLTEIITSLVVVNMAGAFGW